MATQLDRLLENIGPEHTIQKAFNRANEAINTFPLESSLITEWDEYRMVMARFYRHVEKKVLNVQGRMPTTDMDFDWGRCFNTIIKAYGNNGEKTAFELVRTGNDGGLNGVLRKIALAIAEYYSQNEIAARVNLWLNGLSVEEKLAAGDEYIKKFGHLLPSEITEGGAVRIKANLLQVLIMHPRMIHELNKVGRL